MRIPHEFEQSLHANQIEIPRRVGLGVNSFIIDSTQQKFDGLFVGLKKFRHIPVQVAVRANFAKNNEFDRNKDNFDDVISGRFDGGGKSESIP